MTNRIKVQLGFNKQEAIKKERISNTINWYKKQIKECEGYVHFGSDDSLRERAFHAVRYLMKELTAFLSKNKRYMDLSLLAYEY